MRNQDCPVNVDSVRRITLLFLRLAQLPQEGIRRYHRPAVKTGEEQLRARVEKVALVPAEAAGETGGQADCEAEGVVEVRPEDDASVFAA